MVRHDTVWRWRISTGPAFFDLVSMAFTGPIAAFTADHPQYLSERSHKFPDDSSDPLIAICDYPVAQH